MTRVERSIFIDAPPDEVNAIASDPNRWTEWYSNIEEVKVDEVFPQVGGKVGIKFNMMGIPLKVNFIQQEYIPVEKIVCRIEGRIKGESRFELSPEGEGTRTVLSLSYKPPRGLFFGLANSFIGGELVNDNLETSLENLKNLVEFNI